ncbi:ATP-dependent DNA ligase [Candidatus Woesearchaeota archaeon]|nr:MAG: ATP-dependent DNA ligase [Candidatus Woesearchaeota archaeon]
MFYKELVDLYSRLEATSKRLEKTHILSEFLKSARKESVILLLQGKVFPNWDDRELGISSKLALKAISSATGASSEDMARLWNDLGDLGDVAEMLVKNKSQSTLFSEALTVDKVFSNLRKVAGMQGSGTVNRKVQLIAELIANSKPSEAKYVVRTILGELRVGLGEGTMRDALIWAHFGDKVGLSYDVENNKCEYDKASFDAISDLVQRALDVRNDFAEVAILAKRGEGALSQVSLVPGRPVKLMLFQKAAGFSDGFERVGSPCAIEFKYDGFRVQIHKADGKIKLYTRRFEDVTDQFPDVIPAIERIAQDSFILDCEVIGVDKSTGKFLPFQVISQRIRRKHNIEDMALRFPVEVNVFDVLFWNGCDTLDLPFSERRRILESAIEAAKGIKCSDCLITESKDEAIAFYERALSCGNEGVMMKNLKAPYKPGSRVGFGVKVKPTMDTLEVVITGAEWGEGKRGRWLASFIIAVRDVSSGDYLEIGRVGTGIKEKEGEGVSFDQLTQLLNPLILENKGREVKVMPKIVIEVDYEEIQQSPSYSSGFALRFPRFVRLRDDRSASDVSTIDDVRTLYSGQRGRGSC